LAYWFNSIPDTPSNWEYSFELVWVHRIKILWTSPRNQLLRYVRLFWLLSK